MRYVPPRFNATPSKLRLPSFWQTDPKEFEAAKKLEPFIMSWVNKHREDKKRKERDQRVSRANGMFLWKRWLGFKAREDMKKLRPQVKQEFIDNRKYKNFRNRLIGQDGGNRFLQGMKVQALKSVDSDAYEDATVLFDNGDNTYTMQFNSDKRPTVDFKYEVRKGTKLETMKEDSLKRPSVIRGFPCAIVENGDVQARCSITVAEGTKKNKFPHMKITAATGLVVAAIDIWALESVQRGTEKSRGGFHSLQRKAKRKLQRYEANCLSIVYHVDEVAVRNTEKKKSVYVGPHGMWSGFDKRKYKSIDLIFDYPQKGDPTQPESYGVGAKEVMNNLQRLIAEIQSEKAFYWDDNGNHCRIRSSLFERFVQSTADLDGKDDDGESKASSGPVAIPKRMRTAGKFVSGRIRNPAVTETMYFKLKKNQAEYEAAQAERLAEAKRLQELVDDDTESEVAADDAAAAGEAEEPRASADAIAMAEQFPVQANDGGAPGSALDDEEPVEEVDEEQAQFEEAERLEQISFNALTAKPNADLDLKSAEKIKRFKAIELSKKLFRDKGTLAKYGIKTGVSKVLGTRVIIHNPPTPEATRSIEQRPKVIADNTTVGGLKDMLREWIQKDGQKIRGKESGKVPGWDDLTPLDIYLASAIDTATDEFPARSPHEPRFDVFIKNIYKEVTAEEVMKYLKKKKVYPDVAEVTDEPKGFGDDDTRERMTKDPTTSSKVTAQMCIVGYSSVAAARRAAEILGNPDLPPPPFNNKKKFSVGLSRYPGPLQEVEELIEYEGQTLLYYRGDEYIGSLTITHDAMMSKLARRERRMLHLSMTDAKTSTDIWSDAGAWNAMFDILYGWQINESEYIPPKYARGKHVDDLPKDIFSKPDKRKLEKWCDDQRVARSTGLTPFFKGHPKYSSSKLHWERLRKLQSLPDGFYFNKGDKVTVAYGTKEVDIELDFDEEGEVTGKIDTVGELKELVMMSAGRLGINPDSEVVLTAPIARFVPRTHASFSYEDIPLSDSKKLKFLEYADGDEMKPIKIRRGFVFAIRPALHLIVNPVEISEPDEDDEKNLSELLIDDCADIHTHCEVLQEKLAVVKKETFPDIDADGSDAKLVEVVTEAGEIVNRDTDSTAIDEVVNELTLAIASYFDHLSILVDKHNAVSKEIMEDQEEILDALGEEELEAQCGVTEPQPTNVSREGWKDGQLIGLNQKELFAVTDVINHMGTLEHATKWKNTYKMKIWDKADVWRDKLQAAYHGSKGTIIDAEEDPSGKFHTFTIQVDTAVHYAHQESLYNKYRMDLEREPLTTKSLPSGKFKPWHFAVTDEDEKPLLEYAFLLGEDPDPTGPKVGGMPDTKDWGFEDAWQWAKTQLLQVQDISKSKDEDAEGAGGGGFDEPPLEDDDEEEDEPGLEVWFSEEGVGVSPKVNLRVDDFAHVVTMQFTMKYTSNYEMPKLKKVGNAVLEEKTALPTKRPPDAAPLRVGHWITLTNEAEMGIVVVDDHKFKEYVLPTFTRQSETGTLKELAKGQTLKSTAHKTVKHKHSGTGKTYDAIFYKVNDTWICDFNSHKPGKKLLHAEPTTLQCVVEHVSLPKVPIGTRVRLRGFKGKEEDKNGKKGIVKSFTISTKKYQVDVVVGQYGSALYDVALENLDLEAQPAGYKPLGDNEKTRLLGLEVEVNAMLYGNSKPSFEVDLNPKKLFKVAYGEREVKIEQDQIKLAKVNSIPDGAPFVPCV